MFTVTGLDRAVADQIHLINPLKSSRSSVVQGETLAF